MSDTPRTDKAPWTFTEADLNSKKKQRWVKIEFARELERENAALRSAAVEVCALARVWVTVWGDKLSAESIKRLGELEKQILKEAKQ